MTDTHAHLNDDKFKSDVSQVIDNALKAGVDKIIVCGWDIESSIEAVEISNKHRGVFAAVGIHPHDSPVWNEKAANRILDLATADKVVAIGEIGLDYHYDYEIKETQMHCFSQQLSLAADVGMPVSIHSRNAMAETIRILHSFPDTKGVLHFFTGTKKELYALLDMGLYIGVDGPITFRSSDDLRSVIRDVPLDRILLETDCPYLAPVPFRGKRNEPAMLTCIRDYLASLMNITPEELEETSAENTHRLFGI